MRRANVVVFALVVSVMLPSWSRLGLVGSNRLLSRLARPKTTATATATLPSVVPPFSSTEESSYHVPVLRDECLHYLSIQPGGVYVDCTLGGGGHTLAILQAGGRVVAFDQDPDAIRAASLRCAPYLQSGALEIFQANFRSFASVVRTQSRLASDRAAALGLPGAAGAVDGVLMDLGVSSHQINEASRGFSFGQDGPLDMRMTGGSGSTSTSTSGSTSTSSSGGGGGDALSAATIVNEWGAEDLANLLFDFGDETRSRQIAREIVSARPLNSTLQLERCISRVTAYAQRPKTLARCFQALRIAVNDEMGALDEALQSAHDCLPEGGRLVVISYHSLEDRRVKRVMRSGLVDGTGDSEAEGAGGDNPWRALFRRAKPPSDAGGAWDFASKTRRLHVKSGLWFFPPPHTPVC